PAAPASTRLGGDRRRAGAEGAEHRRVGAALSSFPLLPGFYGRLLSRPSSVALAEDDRSHVHDPDVIGPVAAPDALVEGRRRGGTVDVARELVARGGERVVGADVEADPDAA